MIEMRCPFCKNMLHDEKDGYFSCYTDNCICHSSGVGAGGTNSMWETLTHAINSVKIAIRALREIEEQGGDGFHTARKALSDIENELPISTESESYDETLNFVASPIEHPGLVVAGGHSKGQVRRILFQQGKDPANYRIYKLKV